MAAVRARRPAVPSTASAAVKRDLAELAKIDRNLAEGAVAVAALAMAAQLDNPNTSATSKSMCARVLLDMMDRLRELTPQSSERDEIDDLAARRRARLARGAAAKS